MWCSMESVRVNNVPNLNSPQHLVSFWHAYMGIHLHTPPHIDSCTGPSQAYRVEIGLKLTIQRWDTSQAINRLFWLSPALSWASIAQLCSHP